MVVVLFCSSNDCMYDWLKMVSSIFGFLSPKLSICSIILLRNPPLQYVRHLLPPHRSSAWLLLVPEQVSYSANSLQWATKQCQRANKTHLWAEN